MAVQYCTCITFVNIPMTKCVVLLFQTSVNKSQVIQFSLDISSGTYKYSYKG